MYSKLIIIGNLGRDPEMKFTPAGEPVTSFSVAVNDGFGENKRVMWVRVSVWGKQAESCNTYLSKGSKVLVEGRLKSNSDGNPNVYQRKDGTWASSYEVVAESVKFLSGKDEPAAPDIDVAF